MSQTPHANHLPIVRVLDAQSAIAEVESPAPQLLQAPSEEQARVIDGVFAAPAEHHSPMVDAFNLATAGMLLHDIMLDTLAPPANEEEEEFRPKAKPKKEV